jgi:hypothetical protein
MHDDYDDYYSESLLEENWRLKRENRYLKLLFLLLAAGTLIWYYDIITFFTVEK